MQSIAPATLLEPHWFIAGFVVLWLGMSALLALLGGWTSLAARFRSAEPKAGERLRFVSGSIGAPLMPVSYGRSLFLTLSEEGFGLSVLFLFRFLTPPLFIPWREVESVEERRSLFGRYTVVRVRNHWPTISIRGDAGERLRILYVKARAAGAL
jgi:hypothetical protein